MAEPLAFADTRGAPVLVDEAALGGPLITKDSLAIPCGLESMVPKPAFFPSTAEPGIALVDNLITGTWPIPGPAAFRPNHFASGVVRGDDVPFCRTIIAWATGASVEENGARQPELIAEFRARLTPIDRLLSDRDFVLAELSHADALPHVSCDGASGPRSWDRATTGDAAPAP